MKFPRTLKKAIWSIDSYLAQRKYPLNEALTYFAVTGTDGKTTTSSFLYEIAQNLGYKPLLLTTVGGKFNGEDIELDIKSSTFFSYSIKSFISNLLQAKFLAALKSLFFLDSEGFNKEKEKHRTTPLASEIRKIILEYEEKGANFFIIETTSHAIDQKRIDGIKFDAVAFTNITNEHLDYHGTWENYAGTKAKLIDRIKENGVLAINSDDKKSYKFLKEYSRSKNLQIFEYSTHDYKDINPKDFFIKINEETNEIIANTKPSEKYLNAKINLLGKYNIYNSLAAIAAFYGFNKENILGIVDGIGKLKNISGRMEVLKENPKVIVDFAHTPNGMYNALSTIERINGGRIWVIFGCAGERDKYKRPEMGKIAYDFADNILITAEDPRSERLPEINNQIISGFKNLEDDFTINTYYEGLEYIPEDKFIVRFDEPNINSRIHAIKYALENAKFEDTVLILGKGHETSINFDGKEFPWNDIEFVKGNL